jgi:putative pyruvate formate lyase activating enzyme
MVSPAYLSLLKSGELQERVRLGDMMLANCACCGWSCHVDRRTEVKGVCKTTAKARVSSYGPHLGEERPLRGWCGSGAIFFSRCNLRCQYCQNAEISQTDRGNELEPEALAEIMLELQAMGCHNINLVSPTHVVFPIIAAVTIAAQAGLRLPLVYNTGGYDSLEVLNLLDGIIDIYMPDIKYANAQTALRYSKIPHYPETNQAAVREMHRQVGDLVLDENNLAVRGLIIRHLVLPNQISGTEEIVHFLAQQISKDTYLNLMDQYYPYHLAAQYPKLNRRSTQQEYQTALIYAQQAGIHRLAE